MAEAKRKAMSVDIAKRLTDPRFYELLSAQTEDGGHPVIPALRSDALRSVLADIHAAGGAGNVVVPFLNGYMVIAMTFVPAKRRSRAHPPASLNPDQTIGTLIARMFEDGGGDGGELTYCIEGDGPHAEAARADLVGVAV